MKEYYVTSDNEKISTTNPWNWIFNQDEIEIEGKTNFVFVVESHCHNVSILVLTKLKGKNQRDKR